MGEDAANVGAVAPARAPTACISAAPSRAQALLEVTPTSTPTVVDSCSAADFAAIGTSLIYSEGRTTILSP